MVPLLTMAVALPPPIAHATEVSTVTEQPLFIVTAAPAPATFVRTNPASDPEQVTKLTLPPVRINVPLFVYVPPVTLKLPASVMFAVEPANVPPFWV